MCIYALQLKNKMISLIVIMVFLVAFPNRYLHTTPAARLELPDSVKAIIRFLPGYSPDSDGNFEIEVYCQTRFDIESIEIAIGYSEEIAFVKDLPSFNGKMKAGQAKLWKIKGIVKENADFDGTVMPASITLAVRYLFPYKESLTYIEENYRNNIYEKTEYLKYLDDQKDRTINVIKALPVIKPKKL